MTCAGATYNVGNTGGENFHQLTIEEMPSHNHSISYNETFEEGCQSGNNIANGSSVAFWNFLMNTNYTGGNQPHENRPPFYAVYYIIRLK